MKITFKNKKLWIANLIAFVFYGIMSFYVILDTFANYTKYGWHFEEVRLLIFTYDTSMNIGVIVIVLLTAILLLVDSHYSTDIRVELYNKTKSGTSDYGIEFPQGKPDYWDIAANMEKETLEIGLNNAKVSISKQTIDNLFRGEVKKQNE